MHEFHSADIRENGADRVPCHRVALAHEAGADKAHANHSALRFGNLIWIE
jgi:hypothetical protein